MWIAQHQIHFSRKHKVTRTFLRLAYVLGKKSSNWFLLLIWSIPCSEANFLFITEPIFNDRQCILFALHVMFAYTITSTIVWYIIHSWIEMLQHILLPSSVWLSHLHLRSFIHFHIGIWKKLRKRTMWKWKNCCK